VAVQGSRWAGVKRRLIAHIEIWRLDLFSYAGLVSLSGAMLASPDRPVWRLVGAWAAPTLGWLAAMYGGDFFDRDLDAVAKPQRPVPSGRVRPTEAFAGMVTCVALGAVIASLLNPLSLVVVAAALTLGVSYSAYFKAHGILGNLVRGGVTAMAFLQGTLAMSPTPPLRLLPIALIFWCHDSGSNVVGAICDREGDRRGGYRTVPVRHGDTAALRLMVAFDALWLGLAVGYPPTLGRGFNLPAYGPILGVAAALGLVSAGMLLRAPRPVPRLIALRAHEVLVVERLVLTTALIGAVVGVGPAVLLFIPSATATVVAAITFMRRSYEPSRARNPKDTAAIRA